MSQVNERRADGAFPVPNRHATPTSQHEPLSRGDTDVGRARAPARGGTKDLGTVAESSAAAVLTAVGIVAAGASHSGDPATVRGHADAARTRPIDDWPVPLGSFASERQLYVPRPYHDRNPLYANDFLSPPS